MFYSGTVIADWSLLPGKPSGPFPVRPRIIMVWAMKCIFSFSKTNRPMPSS